MIHPDTYVKSTPKGLGLFAKRPFQRGEILWIIDDYDLKIPLDAYGRIEPAARRKLDVYSYLDFDERVIIPWDEGKYVNHACDPNSTGLREFDNLSIARRPIEADEEITEDYGSYFGHFETFPCRCGSPHCRGVVRQDDPYREESRLALAEVAGLLRRLPQPLLTIPSCENEALLQLLLGYQTVP
jgi:hypothetical protein